jgi:hypothetical protein
MSPWLAYGLGFLTPVVIWFVLAWLYSGPS